MCVMMMTIEHQLQIIWKKIANEKAFPTKILSDSKNFNITKQKRCNPQPLKKKKEEKVKQKINNKEKKLLKRNSSFYFSHKVLKAVYNFN